MFQVVFYKSKAGKQPVLEWLRGLDEADRRIIGSDLRTVQIGFPLGMPLCRSLGSQLWELRTNLSSRREARLIFFQYGVKLVIVGGFMKKTQKTPERELEIARKRKEEHEENAPF
ncbi:MAG TPA: type II toxin-antitoxin system RelE/ParE family toxin [Alphaproteobacteria bacterium]|nr:type II toxin-antitoxin system RelE/ParE family toxin [Alphaproteobacteria bacterium]HAJ45850.1 type II toxin-antitoxin system RelE/ParE family toxin [Alphaproteobacteria bacterium]